MSKSKFGYSAAAPSLDIPSSHGSTYLDFIQSRRGVRNPTTRQTSELFKTADEKMMRIQDIVWQIADTNVPVLITGESGVGKEVVAKAIHAAGNDQNNPFIAINCASMPSTLLESELFGYEKGAFTGASQRYQGKFEQANNGTLLLDEITEMDLGLQAKLLRVLQEKEIERIGGNGPTPVNTRIVATTKCDLMACIAKGTFRQDLYYRLYVIHLEIPPLRDRPKDIELLGNYFLSECGKTFGKDGLHFAPDAVEKLMTYQWPGNVRELQNVIQRAAIMATDATITAKNVPIEGERKESSFEWVDALPVGQTLRLVETHFILETLKIHSGNRTHAAKTLGISLRTLRNKINEFTALGYEVMAPQNGRL
jgi:transcriptional regulator with PAS, ATPase and Fis domain